MKTVRLGKTDLEVSRIGMGGIPLTRPTKDEAIKLVQRALDLGITFIDTARGYGPSEERIGRAIATIANRREQVVIATKGGGRSKATALEHIELSLKHLNTDYIDLWQFHGINNLEYYEQILGPGGGMEGAQEALQTGKIRHVGFSSHSLDVALKAVASGHFETVQVPFNFVCNEAADELVPLAREYDIGFIAMKPFAGGMLRDANLAIIYLLQFEGVVPDPVFRLFANERGGEPTRRRAGVPAYEKSEQSLCRGPGGRRFERPVADRSQKARPEQCCQSRDMRRPGHGYPAKDSTKTLLSDCVLFSGFCHCLGFLDPCGPGIEGIPVSPIPRYTG
jgi:diketogulonate reductase-like aldo/keto reductase